MDTQTEDNSLPNRDAKTSESFNDFMRDLINTGEFTVIDTDRNIISNPGGQIQMQFPEHLLKVMFSGKVFLRIGEGGELKGLKRIFREIKMCLRRIFDTNSPYQDMFFDSENSIIPQEFKE